jgi:DNA-binding GntR family transcriptional regulator
MSRVLKRISTVEALVNDLSDRILNGELEPGTPLREIQLAEEYGVGRHTVRAALQHLAQEGLLRHEPNHGARVPNLTIRDVQDLFWLRGVLEKGIVRYLTEQRIVPPEAERALVEYEALPQDVPWEAVVEADMKVHRALVSAADNSRLDRVYRSLSAEIRLCIARIRPFYSSPSKLALEHREILDAISSGHVERAVAVMQAHLQHAVAALTKEGSGQALVSGRDAIMKGASENPYTAAPEDGPR